MKSDWLKIDQSAETKPFLRYFTEKTQYSLSENERGPPLIIPDWPQQGSVSCGKQRRKTQLKSDWLKIDQSDERKPFLRYFTEKTQCFLHENERGPLITPDWPQEASSSCRKQRRKIKLKSDWLKIDQLDARKVFLRQFREKTQCFLCENKRGPLITPDWPQQGSVSCGK